MLRLIAVIAASVLVTTACSSKKTSDGKADPASQAGSSNPGSQVGSAGSGSQAPAGPGAAKPASSLAQVQQWAPGNLHIAAANVHVAAAAVTVPGVELFLVTDGKAPEDEEVESTLVGVIGGADGKIVEGRDLLRAVIDAGPDAKALARVALWAGHRDGDILDAAATPEQRKARVKRPASKGTTFTFWVWTSDVPRSLERGTLERTTGALEIAPPPQPPKVAIANAIATLAGPSVLRHPAAIKTLSEACKDPKAQQALTSALANHARVRTRAAVAGEIHRCGAVAVDPLINVMEQDKSAIVRPEAASALGRIGEPRARAALAKAARSEDANLAWAAKNALGKLK
jgi:HEAT repeat protein